MTTTRQDDDAPVLEDSSATETSSDPDELREQIEETRAELGKTVEALAAKADVKARVKNKVSTGKEQVTEKMSGVSPAKAGSLAAVVVVGLLAGLWLIRRRK
jgi:MYXO-CTERM domain-containing protein